MPNNIKLISKDLLSSNWGKLFKVKYEYKLKDGSWQTQQREVYDRGNGAVILLYNKLKGTVILTEQLRIPTWFNGNTGGLLQYTSVETDKFSLKIMPDGEYRFKMKKPA